MEYFVHLATLFAIYAILGISLNLVVGYTGFLSVTHAAFFGVGAYVTAILMTSVGANFFVALTIGMGGAAICALLIGAVLSRLSGDYYVLGTVGFNFVVFSIFMNWKSLTRGPLGIPGIPRPDIFGIDFFSGPIFLALSVAALVAIYVLARRIVQSSFGRILKAVREDERAIQVFGYRTLSYKLAIFVIAAMMASLAGSLFASYISFIDPVSFSLPESVFILAIVVVGGMANLRGSLLGAFILVLLPELLRFVGFDPGVAAQMRLAIYGVLLTLFMLYRPQGFIGEYKL